jgi:hypothetical protein
MDTIAPLDASTVIAERTKSNISVPLSTEITAASTKLMNLLQSTDALVFGMGSDLDAAGPQVARQYAAWFAYRTSLRSGLLNAQVQEVVQWRLRNGGKRQAGTGHGPRKRDGFGRSGSGTQDSDETESDTAELLGEEIKVTEVAAVLDYLRVCAAMLLMLAGGEIRGDTDRVPRAIERAVDVLVALLTPPVAAVEPKPRSPSPLPYFPKDCATQSEQPTIDQLLEFRVASWRYSDIYKYMTRKSDDEFNSYRLEQANLYASPVGQGTVYRGVVSHHRVDSLQPSYYAITMPFRSNEAPLLAHLPNRVKFPRLKGSTAVSCIDEHGNVILLEYILAGAATAGAVRLSLCGYDGQIQLISAHPWLIDTLAMVGAARNKPSFSSANGEYFLSDPSIVNPGSTFRLNHTGAHTSDESWTYQRIRMMGLMPIAGGPFFYRNRLLAPAQLPGTQRLRPRSYYDAEPVKPDRNSDPHTAEAWLQFYQVDSCTAELSIVGNMHMTYKPPSRIATLILNILPNRFASVFFIEPGQSGALVYGIPRQDTGAN